MVTFKDLTHYIALICIALSLVLLKYSQDVSEKKVNEISRQADINFAAFIFNNLFKSSHVDVSEISTSFDVTFSKGLIPADIKKYKFFAINQPITSNITPFLGILYVFDCEGKFSSQPFQIIRNYKTQQPNHLKSFIGAYNAMYLDINGQINKFEKEPAFVMLDINKSKSVGLQNMTILEISHENSLIQMQNSLCKI